MIYYRHGSRDENKIAITFDDGPNPPITLEILDILDDYDVKANFFVLGKWVKNHPAVLRDMYKRGHLIGNHGYGHDINNQGFEANQEIVFNTIGEQPLFCRPPYCYLEALKVASRCELVTSLKLKLITFDVDPDDNHMPGSDVIFKKVIGACQNGSIIDLHDSSEKPEEQANRPLEMLEALPLIIKSLKEKFEIVRLDQMSLVPIEFKEDSL